MNSIFARSVSSRQSWKGFLGAFVLALSGSTMADVLHITHCLEGCPTGARATNDIVARSIYALSFNHQTAVADWVAYRVTAETVGVASILSRVPLEDPVLSHTLAISDYREYEDTMQDVDELEAESPAEDDTPIIETGRFVPLASFAGTTYWQEVNYLSTMAPRVKDLNKGAWYGLEWAVRRLAGRQGEVYVLTGPTYDSSQMQMKLATNKLHKVPTGFFKVVATASGKVTAFLFDQHLPFYTHHCNQRVKLSEAESQAGLNFFPENSAMPMGSPDLELGCEIEE